MSRFVEKTIGEVLEYIRNAVFSENYSKEKGFLQEIDARAKLIVILGLIFSAVISGRLEVFVIFILISLILAKASKIPIKYYLTRVLIFIPVFTGVIAIPSLFNIFQPYEGTTILAIVKFNHEIVLPLIKPFSEISITKEGVIWAAKFVLRVTTAVSLVTLLVLTTRWSALLSALRSFKLPKVFVVILNLTYRYIFLLTDIVLNMLYSKKSRAIGKEGTIKSWRLNARIVAALFIKSYDMSERVYLAMISRGFDGSFPYMHQNKMMWRDYLFLAGGLLMSLAGAVL